MNKVIEDTMNTINDILLFRLTNYFMRFSAELKKYKHKDFLVNDWYEYTQYGTTNKVCIMLQKNGFSPEAANYIQNREYRFIARTEDGIKIRLSVLQCERKSVQSEARAVYNNVPELFINN